MVLSYYKAPGVPLYHFKAAVNNIFTLAMDQVATCYLKGLAYGDKTADN